MIGLDTNLIVRYLMKDDPKQFARAEALIDSTIKKRIATYLLGGDLRSDLGAKISLQAVQK